MNRRAFTLIELLVVIAVIGLLSTIAVVSLTTAREKARLAAAKQFAAQIDRAEGDSLVGQWDLDEGSGTATVDSSNYGNSGTLVGGPTWSTDTPSGSGTSLASTATGYVRISDNDSLDVRTGNATRTFWFKTSQTDRGVMLRKSDAGNANGMMCEIGSISSGTVDCVLHNTGIVAYASGKYNDGVWHFLALSIDRSANIMNVYLDSKLRGSADISALSANDLNASGFVAIGYLSQGLVGFIDSVHFFGNALTAMDVRQMYLAELPGKLTAVNK